MAVSAIARNLLNALCNLAGHGRFAGYGTHGRFSARWRLLQRSRRSRGGAGFVGAVRGEDILRGKEVGAAEKHIRRMSAACRSGWFPGSVFLAEGMAGALLAVSIGVAAILPPEAWLLPDRLAHPAGTRVPTADGRRPATARSRFCTRIPQTRIPLQRTRPTAHRRRGRRGKGGSPRLT